MHLTPSGLLIELWVLAYPTPYPGPYPQPSHMHPYPYPLAPRMSTRSDWPSRTMKVPLGRGSTMKLCSRWKQWVDSWNKMIISSSSKDDKWSRGMNFSLWWIGCLTNMLIRRSVWISFPVHIPILMIHRPKELESFLDLLLSFILFPSFLLCTLESIPWLSLSKRELSCSTQIIQWNFQLWCLQNCFYKSFNI